MGSPPVAPPSARAKIRGAGASAHVSAAALSGAVTAVLAYFAFTAVPLVPGIQSAIFPGVAWEVVAGIWFGGWGVLGVYLGSILAGTLTGASLLTAPVTSAADLIEALIPALAFKFLKADPRLSKRRDWIIYIVFVILIPHPIGGTWAMGWNTIFGFISWPVAQAIIVGWIINNYVMTAVLSTTLLKSMTAHVQRTVLYVQTFLR